MCTTNHVYSTVVLRSWIFLNKSVFVCLKVCLVCSSKSEAYQLKIVMKQETTIKCSTVYVNRYSLASTRSVIRYFHALDIYIVILLREQ